MRKYIIIPKQVNSFGDWILLVIPLLMVMICGIISFLYYLWSEKGGQIRRGVHTGAFIGGNIFLIMNSFSLCTKFKLIANDGTAYWIFMFLPSFWIGIPAIVVGGILGYIISIFVKRKKY